MALVNVEEVGRDLSEQDSRTTRTHCFDTLTNGFIVTNRAKSKATKAGDKPQNE